MPGKIQPNNNTRSSSLPMDEEVEAVIVVPYILDPVSGEYVPQSPTSAGGAGIDPVSIKDAQVPSRTLKVDADGRIGVEIANFPTSTEIANDVGNPVPISGTVAVSNPTDNPETGLAKEVTLASILAQVDDATADTVLSVLKTIHGNTDTLEALITVIRDEQYRRTDPIATGANVIGKVQLDQAVSNYVSPSTAQDVANGRFFIAGTGRLALTAAGNVRATITNPTGSGKNISIVRLAGLSTGTAWGNLFINPTTGLPASAARRVNNAVLGGGLAAVGVIKADIDLAVPLGGGIDTELVLGIAANSRFSLDFPPLVLGQGVSLGVNIPFAGAADAALSVYWREL